MPRDRDHLDLPRWQGSLTRRRHGGGRPPQRPSKQDHGRRIEREVRELEQRLKERQLHPPPGVNPKLIFKLRLHPRGTLTEEQLLQLGLRTLARDSERAIVVFPDRGTLDELQRRIREYAGLVDQGR